VIVGMQVNAEDARRQDAVAHLELPQLHVAQKLVDNDLAVDTWLLRLPGLRHPTHLAEKTKTIDAPTGTAGFGEARGRQLSYFKPEEWPIAAATLRHRELTGGRGARPRPSARTSAMQLGRRYGDTHCTEKLVPSDEGADGDASVARVGSLTIVMANTSALGNVLNAPLCDLSLA